MKLQLYLDIIIDNLFLLIRYFINYELDSNERFCKDFDLFLPLEINKHINMYCKF